MVFPQLKEEGFCLPNVKIDGGEGSWIDLDVPVSFFMELSSGKSAKSPNQESSGPTIAECISLQRKGDSAIVNSDAGTVIVTLGDGVVKVKFLAAKPRYD